MSIWPIATREQSRDAKGRLNQFHQGSLTGQDGVKGTPPAPMLIISLVVSTASRQTCALLASKEVHRGDGRVRLWLKREKNEISDRPCQSPVLEYYTKMSLLPDRREITPDSVTVWDKKKHQRRGQHSFQLVKPLANQKQSLPVNHLSTVIYSDFLVHEPYTIFLLSFLYLF